MSTMLKVLHTQQMPNDTEVCSIYSHTVISDSTRFFHYNDTLNHCDSDLTEGWYKFEINDSPAEIPRTCLRNRLCGAQLPLRLDLGNQALPGPNVTVWAHVCTSFDILGKWDCCVLRRRVGIRNCGDFYVYHLLPTDRCSVRYCVQETGDTPSKEYLAIAGEPVTAVQNVDRRNDTAITYATSSSGNESTETTTATISRGNATSSATTSTTPATGSRQCPRTRSYPCYGNRTCHMSSNNREEIQCADGHGCAIPCNGVPGCDDESDERDPNVCPTPVVCTEGMRKCPGESKCYTPCDGNQECGNGFDETDCGQVNNIPAQEQQPVTLTSATSSAISSVPVSSSVTPPIAQNSSTITDQISTVTTTVSSTRTSPSDVLTSSSALPTTTAVSESLTTPTVFNSSQTVLPSPTTSTRLDTVSETNVQATAGTISSTLGVQERHMSTSIQPSPMPFSANLTSGVGTTSMTATQSRAMDSLSSVGRQTASSTVETSSPSSVGGLAESVTPSLTATPGLRSITLEDSSGSVITRPIILTFDIIGTAYRNAEERIEEQTFETILQQAIADVLNEYSNRDRREIQNFTRDHVQIINTEKGGENVSVSIAVNSTKLGENFVPAIELETIFNQTAIETLCNQPNKTCLSLASPIFGASITLQTPTVPSSSAFTSQVTSVSSASCVSASPLLSSTTSPTDALTMTSVDVSSTIPHVVEPLTTTTTSSFEYEASATPGPSESSITIAHSSTQADLVTLASSPSNVTATTIISPSTTISTQFRATEPPTLPSVISPTAASSTDSFSTTDARSETDTGSSSIYYSSEMPKSSLESSQFQTAAASPSTISLTTESTKSSVLSSILSSSPAASESSTPGLYSSTTLLSQSGIIETIPTIQGSDSTISSIESTAELASGWTSAFEISSSEETAMTPSPTLEHTEVLSTTVSQTEPTATTAYSETKPASETAPVSAVIEPSAVSTPVIVSTVRPSHMDSSLAVDSFASSRVSTLTPPLPGLGPSSSAITSQEEPSKSTDISYPYSSNVSEEESVLTAFMPTAPFISPSMAKTAQTYTSFIYNVTTSSIPKSTTISVETVTVISTTERNLTLDKPISDEEKLFEKNFGLFVFLIVAGSCMMGACCFVFVAKLYRNRRYSWEPEMAYQDAYADMEKANLSFSRDALGVESPIPDIDILKGESNEQETSLSKASTLTLPRTPKNEASQTDITQEPGPSGGPDDTVQSHAIIESRDKVSSADSGHENQGFETDTDSGVDGIVPIDEIDSKPPRIAFPWMDQLADTKL